MKPHFLWLSALCAALLTASVCAQTALPQPTPKVSLLVLSKQDHTLAIVDPTTLGVVARIPVGDDPHEVIASTDGTTAYVSNYGSGAFHTLAVVDLIHQKRLPSIDLGALRGPHGLAFVQGKVWFTAEAAKAIGNYNPATGKIDWIMGTGQNRTHMLHVFPSARRILTTNVDSGTVTMMEKVDAHSDSPMGNWQLTVVPVGSGSEGFDVSPDGKEAWVANAGDGTISIIDIASKKVIATLAAEVPDANRLKFTPDGRMVLVSAGPDLVILDAASHYEIKRLVTGHDSGGVLVQPDGKRAYESCASDNYVVVVDLKTLQVVGHIQAGGGPDGLAWAVQP